MAITIKSFNQFLGNLIRKIVADTPVNDINTGSALFSLLEAVAANDFENNAAILNVLELLNIDALRNNDLDAKAADFGLERRPAVRSSGFVEISDSNITKRSTGLFPVKPAPIAGSTKIFVNDASGWAATGQLYIGRGTNNFEGPISYTSIVDNTTFFTIDLGSALQKDHLISEVVVDGQGTADRLIAAGTTVKIPANSQSPAIEYESLRDAVIPAGEDAVENVEIIAILAGSQGNAGINTITKFDTVPFAGALASNTGSFSNGRDIESDDELRDRIKAFAQTLARGTKAAILEAVIGISDPTDNKQVASAVITEPVSPGEPSIIFIDDGSGFQPSFTGQNVDFLLKSASGDEEFLQLANFPLPRPQVINVADGPYELNNGMEFRVRIDDEEETVTFSTDDFVNISSATLPEIVTKINDTATVYKARLTDNSTRLLLYANSFDAEIIQVIAIRTTDDPDLFANNILKFPTNEFSHITLYQNDELLREKEKSAALETTPFSTWNIIADSNIIISVDGTPAQDRLFASTDFGGASYASLTLQDWVDVFNLKFAGLRAEVLSSGSMRIVSNKVGSESGIDVVGGSLLTKWFADLDTSSVGQTAEFELNRQNGNIRILTDIETGDDISAGVEDAKGSVVSTATVTGNYNVSGDANGVAATLVIVADADEVISRPVSMPIGSTVTISDEGSNVMRVLASTLSAFRGIFPTTSDYLFISDRTTDASWVDTANTGLYKVVAKGPHTSAGVDSYIDVLNHNTIVPGVHTVNDSDDIQAFFSDAYPQIWLGSFVDNPPSSSIQDIVDSINSKISNVTASIFKTNSIKLTSSTEEDGSIAIPISIGNAELLFEGRVSSQTGNPPLVANRAPEVEAVTWFKRTIPTNTNVFFGRYSYVDLKGSLTTTATPGIEGVDAFSEVLESTGVLTDANLDNDNIISLTKGNNEGHFRSVRQILSGDRIGTQFGNPRTVLGHMATNDELQILKSLELSSEDNIVFILDKDSVNKTIDIPLFRTGLVNSGSQAGSFLPTDLAFSADDADNEPDVDFGTPQVWSKTLNGTEFRDYKVWLRARNWYASDGVSGSDGKMLVRSVKYGPAGEKIRFAIDYPNLPNATSIVSCTNDPFFSECIYYFGSGAGRTTNITGGTSIDVADLGSDNFRLSFPVGIDLSTIVIGDVFSALNDSGLSVSNRGQYRINAINAPARTLDVYNPNGSPTGAGTAEVTDITCIADIVGSTAQHTVTTVADVADSLDGTYFILYDQNGSVAFWIDNNDSGTAEPVHGATRSVEITTIATSDTDSVVASKIATIINDDPEFSASSLGAVITADNVGVGLVTAGGAGTSGFTVTPITLGIDTDTLDGKYFIIQDQGGSVAFWFDVGATGTLEPIHGADRSVQIATVVAGDNANTVAGRVHAIVNGDSQFTAIVALDTVTVTDILNENRPAPSSGTSGFTLLTVTNGSDGAPESVTIGSSVSVFPLTGTMVSDIVTKVNEDDILLLVAVGDDSLIINKATREEVYVPAGPSDYSDSLAFDHDPDPTNGKYEYISLRDSETWVLDFRNTNPNFTLKKELELVGVAPSIYAMDTAPNSDSAETGEFFKMMPTSIDNLRHHLTQKALSQLPIVSDIKVTDESRKLQIKSNELGSEGAIEVVGGQGNTFTFPVIGDSQSLVVSGKEFLSMKIKAFPDTINPGDTVKLQNIAGVQRLSRLESTDSIDVVKISDTNYEYRYNAKDTFLSQFVDFSVVDVSASHGRPAGFIWRWTHSDAGSFFGITEKVDGVPASQPDDELAAGGSDAVALEVLVDDPGTVSTPLDFKLTVSAFPTQADYFTFETAGGTTFAVWFDIDGAGTAPAGGTYTGASNQIEVDIVTGDTLNQIVSKLATTLIGDSNFTAAFDSSQTQGATFADVNEGDILHAFDLPSPWASGNMVSGNGDEVVSGFPIIGVNEVSKYVDVVNPFGEAMSAEPIGAGTVQINPTQLIDWKPTHTARTSLVKVEVSASVATATTVGAHRLNIGDTFNILNNDADPSAPGSGVGTVTTVAEFNQFTYATGVADATYLGGSILDDTKSETRYKIEKLKFKNLVRISRVTGESPSFLDVGVAVDDLMILQGNTFNSNNNGIFRVRGVDNDSIVYENVNAREEVNTDAVPFNNSGIPVNWIANSILITGNAGDFENLSIGDSVRKLEDVETLFAQVLSFNTGLASTATQVTLNTEYKGSTSTSLGIRFDQENDVEKGVILQSITDLRILEGDAVRSGDSLFISNIVNTSWFSSQNVGTFDMSQVGTSTDYKPFIRVINEVAIAETDRLLSIDENGIIITENDDNRFDTIREIDHIAIDEFSDKRRIVYLSPGDRAYKFSESNNSQIVPVGKLNYPTDITTGIDGYTYYTGLLRTVQRVIDGFEPEADTFPGRRAVGGIIEILPPLIRRIVISIDITTNEGVNLGEISNEIKSIIINYVNILGVGEDVILSEIISKVMQIRGVEAATFNIPTATTERISISDIEKALIKSKDISIA